MLTTRLSSSISFYKTLLGIRTVVPISETTVQLEYDIPSSNPITLLLEYDPLSRRLIDASVRLFPSFSISFSFLLLLSQRMREEESRIERKEGS
jgi:hypothetical protein